MTKIQNTTAVFRLSATLEAELKEKARREGRPLSQLLREAAEEYNKEARMKTDYDELPDVLDLVAKQGEALKAQPTAQESLLSLIESFGKELKIGNRLDRALATEAVKEKERSAGNKTKDLGVIPYGITSFEALDSWREAQASTEKVLDDTTAMLEMIRSIAADESITDKSRAYTDLAGEFSSRLARQGDRTKAKGERAGVALTLARSMAQIHTILDNIEKNVQDIGGGR